MRIVFLDGASPFDYSPGSDRIGGAEGSLIEIAQGLGSDDDVSVVVTKLPRGFQRSTQGVTWLGPGRAALRALLAADAVVVQRRAELAVVARILNPRARILTWYHDWSFPVTGGRNGRMAAALKSQLRILFHLSSRARAVVVSRAHRENFEALLDRAPVGADRVRITVINNPVRTSDRGSRREDPVDLDKMIYFSAPWKGLSQVLDAFASVRRSLPEMQLHVASPGYSAHEQQQESDGVRYLGYLSHEVLFQEVQSSLCVFYPADTIPETFGLIFIESHEVGTPVLAHPFGAAPELLSPEELVDAHDYEAIAARVRSWRTGGRPVVSGRDDFGVAETAARWRAVLTSTRGSRF